MAGDSRYTSGPYGRTHDRATPGRRAAAYGASGYGASSYARAPSCSTPARVPASRPAAPVRDVPPGASEELLRLLARALVAEPDQVSVTAAHREGLTVLTLEVAEDDVGRVIGKQGRIIKAIRKVIRTTGGPAGKTLVVEVVSR